MKARGRGKSLETGNLWFPAVGGGLGIFRAGLEALKIPLIPFNGAPRLATRGLWSVFRNIEADRRPSPSVTGDARPLCCMSAMVCETTAGAALTVRMRCGGGGSPRGGAEGGGGGGVDRDGEGECEGGLFGTALCTRERGGGGGAAWEEVGGGGGAARFGGLSKEVPVGRGGGGGAPRVEWLECEGGGGGTLRAGRLGAVVVCCASDDGVAAIREGGGGTGRPMVEDLIGGGGGAGAAGGAALRLGGREGTMLLVAALDPEVSVAAAETSDAAVRGARGGARGGSWNGRSGGGGGGSVGGGAEAVAERGIGGGFARPVILASH